MYDAVIIGGGFYGAVLAIYLTTQRQFARVLLLEREKALLARASYNNQARVHYGYHYPRSYTTAYRSRVNLPRFVHDFPAAVKTDFTKLYAIARRNSKVTATQFARFCHEIGAEIESAPQALKHLFEPKLIEAVFLVKEYAFDATRLRAWAEKELHQHGVEIQFGVRVTAIRGDSSTHSQSIQCVTMAGEVSQLASRYVFNCTYSGLNQFSGDFTTTKIRLKHEITEMGLMAVPATLRDLGVTVMDGPFFSIMPFPARNLHSLSHVRYTPHLHWFDKAGVDPYKRLEQYAKESRVDRMVRDAARYLPALLEVRQVDSLFEVKTVLVKNESDDGRPILFERHVTLPNCYSIMGGKIDNIYDVLEKLDAEPLLLG
jgi:glycine/D-amino acid oxidase-like deaminating enzyme